MKEILYVFCLHATATLFNGHIQYLFGIPLERVYFFDGPEKISVSSKNISNDPDDLDYIPQEVELAKPLLPDWMREDLNLVASELYMRFLNETDLSHLDPRSAEAVVQEFRNYQGFLFNETLLEIFLTNKDQKIRNAFDSLAGFRKLLAKMGTDFATKMGFDGGTRYLYTARLHAAVFGPGDATIPQGASQNGGVASGVVFTNLPESTIGTNFFEIMDPRGHNPPFGKDEKIPLVVGLGLFFPSWLHRFVPPYRHGPVPAPRKTEWESWRADILGTRRIDWVFEIGLFQYSPAVLSGFVDFEHCPFQDGFRAPQAQIFFNLEVEQLAAIEAPPKNSIA